MTVATDWLGRAQAVIPGGVNSPVRSFKSVGGTPHFITRAHDAYVVDVDGNEYIDYVCSWGALLLGHAHPAVVEAVAQAAGRGTSYGAPTPGEVELAELITGRVPAAEQIRLVNSGTEATMTAVRLARGFTERPLILRFHGCYHGHADSLLANADLIDPASGVPAAIAEQTLAVPYNDIAAVENCFAQHRDQIAAVIVEPVAANMGVVPPQPDFLHGLRDLTAKHGALLIHDEVITGFRVSPSGWCGVSDVAPDLLTFGKVIGGGLPVGAIAGRREILEHLAPLGPVYQAGTLAGNPLAMAAGMATLQNADDGVYKRIAEYAAGLTDSINDCAQTAGIPCQVNYEHGLFSVFFSDTPVVDYGTAQKQSTARYAAFFHSMLDAGIYLPPSPYEGWFVSSAHNEATLGRTRAALPQAMRAAAAV